MANRIRPLCFLVFTDSLKLVESCHLRRKLGVAKLHSLCTDKYRNDKLMKESLLLLQRVGENRPAMNASFPAGNKGAMRATARVQLDNSSAARHSVQRTASQSFTAMKCL